MADLMILSPSKEAKPFMGTREEARAVGAVRYIDGRLCNRGHIPTIRLTSNTQCVACRDMKQAEIKTFVRSIPGFISGMELRGKPVYRGTAQQAKTTGALYYINYRRPCNKGHDPAVHLTSTTACVLCANKYHDDHKEEISEKKRQHRVDNRELYSEIGRARYAANPNYFKAYAKGWLDNNRDHKRATDAIWLANHVERLKEYWTEWRLRNPDKVAAKTHKRRARKLGSTMHFIANDVALVLQTQGHACAYCWIPITKKTRAIDHFIPLAREGSNGPENIIGACRSCNHRKSSRLPAAFINADRDRLLRLRATQREPDRASPLLPILAIIDDLLD